MIDWHYIRTQLKRYPHCGDTCLYYIGTHAHLLSEADLNQMHGGQLTAQARSRVLNWLRQNANCIGLTLES